MSFNPLRPLRSGTVNTAANNNASISNTANNNNLSNNNSSTLTREQSDFHSYLRSLQARAMDVSNSIAKLDLRSQPQNWSVYLARFTLLSTQLTALGEELYTSINRTASRNISNQLLIQPLIAGYNPSIQLRTKPIIELEQSEQNILNYIYNNNSNNTDNTDISTATATAAELESKIEEFNSACIELNNRLIVFQSNLSTVDPISTGNSNITTVNTDNQLSNTLGLMFNSKLIRQSIANNIVSM